jgi:hypothetical protein
MTNYSEEDILRGLAALALHSGNARRASADLKGQGLCIPKSTLQSWQVSKRDRYEEIRASWLPQVHAAAAEKHQALAFKQAEVSDEMTDLLRKAKGDVPVRDLPGAIRNMSTASGIHQDKAQTLRAEAQPHIDLPDIAETLRALRASGVTNIRLELVDDEEEAIPGTATEVPEPRLPSGH